MREDQIFNDLTDELFGFIAQMGLRRLSSEVSKGEHKATDYQVLYDGIVQFARRAHSECLKVRERMLSNVRNDEEKVEDEKFEVDRVMEFMKWVFCNTIEDNYGGLRSSNKGACLDEINEKSGEILESSGINLGELEDQFAKEVESRIAQGRFP